MGDYPDAPYEAAEIEHTPIYSPHKGYHVCFNDNQMWPCAVERERRALAAAAPTGRCAVHPGVHSRNEECSRFMSEAFARDLGFEE